MADSVLQAGPMVQMIFARRGEGLAIEGSAIGSGLLTCLLAFNLSPRTLMVQFGFAISLLEASSRTLGISAG
jgi:hypothetical protein